MRAVVENGLGSMAVMRVLGGEAPAGASTPVPGSSTQTCPPWISSREPCSWRNATTSQFHTAQSVAIVNGRVTDAESG